MYIAPHVKFFKKYFPLLYQQSICYGFSLSDLGYKADPVYNVYHDRISPKEENEFLWRTMKGGYSKHNGNLLNEEEYFDMSREDNRKWNTWTDYKREKSAQKYWDNR